MKNKPRPAVSPNPKHIISGRNRLDVKMIQNLFLKEILKSPHTQEGLSYLKLWIVYKSLKTSWSRRPYLTDELFVQYTFIFGDTYLNKH